MLLDALIQWPMHFLFFGIFQDSLTRVGSPQSPAKSAWSLLTLTLLRD
jgi:hypothetical protein